MGRSDRISMVHQPAGPLIGREHGADGKRRPPKTIGAQEPPIGQLAEMGRVAVDARSAPAPTRCGRRRPTRSATGSCSGSRGAAQHAGRNAGAAVPAPRTADLRSPLPARPGPARPAILRADHEHACVVGNVAERQQDDAVRQHDAAAHAVAADEGRRVELGAMGPGAAAVVGAVHPGAARPPRPGHQPLGLGHESRPAASCSPEARCRGQQLLGKGKAAVDRPGPGRRQGQPVEPPLVSSSRPWPRSVRPGALDTAPAVARHRRPGAPGPALVGRAQQQVEVERILRRMQDERPARRPVADQQPVRRRLRMRCGWAR